MSQIRIASKKLAAMSLQNVKYETICLNTFARSVN